MKIFHISLGLTAIFLTACVAPVVPVEPSRETAAPLSALRWAEAAYQKDAKAVYFKEKPIEGVDPQSFAVLPESPSYPYDSAHLWFCEGTGCVLVIDGRPGYFPRVRQLGDSFAYNSELLFEKAQIIDRVERVIRSKDAEIIIGEKGVYALVPEWGFQKIDGADSGTFTCVGIFPASTCYDRNYHYDVVKQGGFFQRK